MNLSPSPIALTDPRPNGRTSGRAYWRVPQRAHPRQPGAGAITAHVRDRHLCAVEPTDRRERPVVTAGAFSAVLCGVDRSANARAARVQAQLLASPGGTVRLVPAPTLTKHGERALYDGCDGHDLVVLGGGAAAHRAVRHARIPVLIARTCPLGTKLTDTVLVPVDESPDSRRAVELAGRLAALNGGTVSIVQAPPPDAALQRATAGSSRVLLGLTGAVPRIYGEQASPERAIPSAAATLTASLVILGSGNSGSARRMTAQMVGSIGCSVLVIPAPLVPEQQP